MGVVCKTSHSLDVIKAAKNLSVPLDVIIRDAYLSQGRQPA